MLSLSICESTLMKGARNYFFKKILMAMKVTMTAIMELVKRIGVKL